MSTGMKFTEIGMVEEPPCFYCKHLVKAGGLVFVKAWRCKAFPYGIPVEILRRELDHSQPLDGDNGIQYESERYQDEGRWYTIDFDGTIRWEGHDGV